ncbi:olfactory receptor 10A2-like [Alligator mississippiensis]|uniref:olfactory receptor 10A2-like n=1 Tax=Alligator mississippiensis TaxID=8496 RepID=UPI0028778EEC|nr:olfactory receptor 10A2-like [Alligator mississippiensis]
MAVNTWLCPCNPLCYTVIMNRRFSFQLVVASWISGIPVGIVQTMWLFSFPFCGHNEINHFCDGPPVLVLVCADTSLFHIYSNTATFLIVISPFVLILASYTCILCTVLKMQSLNGKHKAFSTCSSHLMVLTLLYITFSLTYIQYKTKYWPNTNKILSFSYTAITLMLNPIIYSMRNNIVKGALRRTLSRNTDVPTRDLTSAQVQKIDMIMHCPGGSVFQVLNILNLVLSQRRMQVGKYRS